MRKRAVPSSAMTTPHDAPQQFGHPSTWPTPAESPAPPAPRPRRTGLIAAAVAGVLALMAGTGVSVWLLTRPDAAAPAAASSAAASATEVTVRGVVTLQQGQFSWNSEQDPTCQGWKGFSDIRVGAQVTVTDAAGKVLAVSSLDVGQAKGIAAGADGMKRATTCELAFRVAGVASGQGPYGVEVSHRGVLRYDEGRLSAVTLGFS